MMGQGWGSVSALEGVERLSVLTCPFCGFRREEAMPTDACVYFYRCHACGATLKPRPGDCCVFCPYGSAPCPPRQPASPSDHSGATDF